VAPEILLIDRDSGEDLVVNSYFATNYRGMISEKNLSVMNKVFTVSIHRMMMGSNNNGYIRVSQRPILI
jgi:hypothetical protein